MPIHPTAAAPTVIPARVRGAAAQSAALEVWESSAGAVLASLSAAGGLTLSDALVGVSAALTGALSADSGTLNSLTVANAAAVGALSTCPTVTPNTDRTTKMASTAFVHDCLDAFSLTKAHRDTHVVAWDDKTSPRSDASVVGSIPISIVAGGTCKLIGVKIKCSSRRRHGLQNPDRPLGTRHARRRDRAHRAHPSDRRVCGHDARHADDALGGRRGRSHHEHARHLARLQGRAHL